MTSILRIAAALTVVGTAASWATDTPAATEPPELPRIAVLAYRNRTEVDSLNALESVIRHAVSNRLMATGRVLIVPQDEVEAVLDTLAPELGYLTNERQAFRLGKTVDAEKVIFGSFTRSGDVINIKTYIVDCDAMTVHTIEQAETRVDLSSDQAGVETARVVQGQVAGITPTGSAPQRAPLPVSSPRGNSRLVHLEPWAALGATASLVFLTYHYDTQASNTWDSYLRAVREHEITRLYNKASDYLLARNVLAVLTTGSLALTIHYWFAHDFGSSEQWSRGSPGDNSWAPAVTLSPESIGVVFSRRF